MDRSLAASKSGASDCGSVSVVGFDSYKNTPLFEVVSNILVVIQIARGSNMSCVPPNILPYVICFKRNNYEKVLKHHVNLIQTQKLTDVPSQLGAYCTYLCAEAVVIDVSRLLQLTQLLL